jgi:hypothetical protein
MFASRLETKGDKYADRLNGMKKLVASRTLKKMAWLPSLQRSSNSPAYGITNLDRTLLAADLVDEIRFG